jgi:hypothetical protein
MTDPEKLRALIAEMRRANECINAAVTATDYQVACVALALIARQFLRDSEALSTLLAEAEPSMGASMGDSMGNPDRNPHSAAVYDFDKESRIVCEAIGSPVGRMTVACALREAYQAGRAERPTPPVEDDWALARVRRMAETARTNAGVYGAKLLKGHGYPDEVMRDAQDAIALEEVLTRLTPPVEDAVDWKKAWHALSHDTGMEIEKLKQEITLLQEDAVTRAKLENCQHERLNDHGDACLDCRAIYMDGKWQ